MSGEVKGRRIYVFQSSEELLRYAPHMKRISAGPGPDMYTATFEPTDLQWQFLEDALDTKRIPKKTPKFRFSKKTSSDVQIVCILFAIFGTETTVPIHATVLKIEKWLDQTRKSVTSMTIVEVTSGSKSTRRTRSHPRWPMFRCSKSIPIIGKMPQRCEYTSMSSLGGSVKAKATV